MTQRTHDLGAILFVSYGFLNNPQIGVSWPTILGIGIATIIGAVLPDIDNVASPAWKDKLFPWDRKMTQKFMGGHRHLSHSLLGGLLFYFFIGLFLSLVHIPDLNINLVRHAFILGFLSHLILDTLTHEGVPWLYPIPFHLGFPPIQFLRLKTGGLLEKIVVFPLLLIGFIWVYYNYRQNIPIIFKSIP